MRYRAEAPPQGGDPVLAEYLNRELNRIADALATVYDLEKQYAAPERVRDGMLRYADGTAWNPGSGAGIYYYNGSAWIKL